MPNTLQIYFHDNTFGVFSPGQEISGYVKLDVEQPIRRVQGLRLHFEGKAVCDWPIDATGQATGIKLFHHGEETVFEETKYMFGSKGGDHSDIAFGYHTYAFSCQLPPSIPHSSEGPKEGGQFGHVRYTCDATVLIFMGIDLKTRRTFTVAGVEDLNLSPELRMPCEIEEIKTFCCWCCTSDPLIVKVCLPKTGFAAGEVIPVAVEIQNKGSTEVSHSVLALEKVYTLQCTAPRVKTRKIRETAFEMNSRGVKAGETVAYKENIQLPENIEVSNSGRSKVFQMDYEIKVVAETSGVSVSPEVCVPITIGSVALT